MKEGSKRYMSDKKKLDRSKKYDLDEAVNVLKTLGTTKFDQAVNIAMRLNIDVKKSDQLLRGSFSLPNGIGKSKKVIVFADAQEAKTAQEAGADLVGMDDLAKKIQDGWDDFDIAVAIPRAMKVVSRLGKILGPKGKMPSAKNGTLTEDIATAVKEFKAGRIEFRNDADGNIHAPVGKLSFSEEALKQNILSFFEHVRSLRPSSIKGFFITSCYLSATMSPSIELSLAPC